MNILLTGASRGLGLEIASHLLANGCHLWLPVRSSNGPLLQLTENSPGAVNLIDCNLSDVDQSHEKISAVLRDDAVSLDGLVNNAAVAYDDLVTNLQIPPLEAMFRTNVFAPMILTRLAVRNMLLHSKQGSLVHIGSVCSHTGYKGLAMYGATKGALESFSRGVAREWGSKGIRSNCVVPGFMETDMSASIPDATREKIYNRTSLRKPTDPKSVASTVEFLLSNASRSITGQSFPVDCGTL